MNRPGEIPSGSLDRKSLNHSTLNAEPSLQPSRINTLSDRTWFEKSTMSKIDTFRSMAQTAGDIRHRLCIGKSSTRFDSGRCSTRRIGAFFSAGIPRIIASGFFKCVCSITVTGIVSAPAQDKFELFTGIGPGSGAYRPVLCSAPIPDHDVLSFALPGLNDDSNRR